MSWDVAIGYFTGLRFINASLDSSTLVRTALAVHTSDAVVCRLIAHNRGYSKNLCTLFGFLFGVWAVGLLLLLPGRAGNRPPQ